MLHVHCAIRDRLIKSKQPTSFFSITYFIYLFWVLLLDTCLHSSQVDRVFYVPTIFKTWLPSPRRKLRRARVKWAGRGPFLEEKLVRSSSILGPRGHSCNGPTMIWQRRRLRRAGLPLPRCQCLPELWFEWARTRPASASSVPPAIR
jgi:hypothetical protein